MCNHLRVRVHLLADYDILVVIIEFSVVCVNFLLLLAQLSL